MLDPMASSQGATDSVGGFIAAEHKCNTSQNTEEEEQCRSSTSCESIGKVPGMAASQRSLLIPGFDSEFHDQANTGIPDRPDTSLHFLLLLSDSALPLGSFAFSSGLESYQAHLARGTPTNFAARFLPLSLSSYSSTSLPFLIACHRDPSAIASLDDTFDAATLCSVGRRASITQGRALLSIWDRSFAPSQPSNTGTALREYSKLVKTWGGSTYTKHTWSEEIGDIERFPPVQGHLAPLFGAITRLVGLSLHQAAYTFLLSHVKAVTSAAVRANIVGPFQAQKVLASAQVQGQITALIAREWDTPVEEAAQDAPVLDIWMGRHELLYSRIFNS